MKHKIARKQINAKSCLVCGYENDFGLHMSFYETEDNLVVGTLNGSFQHQSYPERMHGGLITAALDETIGRALWLVERDIYDVTTEINVKFRKPVPLGKELYVVGEIVRNTSRIFEGAGKITDETGAVYATATGTYFKIKSETEEMKAEREKEILFPDERTEFEF